MNGWEPRTFTDHEYDGDGRLVRTVTHKEPEFSAQDRLWLLAVEAYKADLGPHGFSMHDVTDPANQFAYVAASPPLMDWAAQTIAVAQEQFYKANPDGPRGGHLWSALKRPT